MKEAPCNSDDVIDSRDIIARIDELEALKSAVSDAEDELKLAEGDDVSEAQEALDDAEADFDDDAKKELKALRALAEEGESYSEDWRHGATLIHENYFVEYCQEMVSDIGDLPKDIPGYLVIDWEATSDNLRVDYTEVDFAGTTYLLR